LETNPRIEAVVKVKVKVKVKFNLEQGTKVQRGITVEVYLYSFFNLGAIGGGLSTPHPGPFTLGKHPVHIVQNAGWTPGTA
jgi:hypothetical protein